jgi:hypothetical protein
VIIISDTWTAAVIVISDDRSDLELARAATAREAWLSAYRLLVGACVPSPGEYLNENCVERFNSTVGPLVHDEDEPVMNPYDHYHEWHEDTLDPFEDL